MKFRAIAYALPPLLLLLSCGKSGWKSQWRDREIIVDGSQADWDGKMTYLEKQNLSFGLLNDENFMYLCLVTNDRDLQRQLMRQGFILWFDPAGGNDKHFGIRFPIGMFAMEMPMMRGPQMREGGESEMEPEDRRKIFAEALQELEILGPGKDDRHRTQVASAKGLELKLNEDENGTLVYELKVPLAQSEEHPYAIGAEAGKKIGVGLETPEIDREQMRERMHGSFGGGWHGGGMGGHRPGGGPGEMGRPEGFGGHRPEMAKPLKVWAEVQLASGKPFSSSDNKKVYGEQEESRFLVAK